MHQLVITLIPHPSSLIAFVNSVTLSLGYVADPTQFIRGLSPLHDSGTGSSLGSHNNHLAIDSYTQS